MLVCGVGVIASRNPIHSVMSLVVLFFFMAGLFVLLEAYFLAIIQVLVYAGAVMVLFLFIIMLLDLKVERQRCLSWPGLIGGVLLASLFGKELWDTVRKIPAGTVSALPGTTENVGGMLFRDYLLPFEITSLILLVATIGVILLSRKEVS